MSLRNLSTLEFSRLSSMFHGSTSAVYQHPMEEVSNSYACNDGPCYTGTKVETENYSQLNCCEVRNTNEKETHVLLYNHYDLKELNAISDFKSYND